jgi:type III restriction enzyme
MSNPFFDHPILNNPYLPPSKHWELDEAGQPTQRIVDSRRRAEFITPIPKPRKARPKQTKFVLDEGQGLSNSQQSFLQSLINDVRKQVAIWLLGKPSEWQVTPETQRLLLHWRNFDFPHQRPFFCQLEAVQTAIWLTEVAPKNKTGQTILKALENANLEANPLLDRVALKLATGAGKTTVMAMLIAWQTINAIRHPSSKLFSKGFLIVTPGLTIRDRLRVLQPSDPENYYKHRSLVPIDLLDDLNKAKIVITNFQALKRRELWELPKVSRQLLEGRTENPIDTLESEGQMVQRVMNELMGLKRIVVMNDEAHHCYREKPAEADDAPLSGDDRKQADRNNEYARLWINGLEAVQRKLGIQRVYDLSATPFFLRGSGYPEGTLFGWTVSDFSLMDAIECGIVKLPRVPIDENITGSEMPIFRNLWENIRDEMPKSARGDSQLDPLQLPTRLQTAMEALYGHYEKTFRRWEQAGIRVPPCFIIVCQNTAISKLVYDYVSGFHRSNQNNQSEYIPGRLRLFRNFDDHGNPLPKPNTLLIDSEQLECEDSLDKNFRQFAADEIERFRRDLMQRSGDPRAGDSISDQQLLREVMNTVGKEGQLGGQIRCVVSVSMLTEGWDANTVTHILGVRAFGTQLLCEQVIGRALRRQSYDLNEENLFDVEYADVFGIPFDFTAKPVIAKPAPVRETYQVRAVRPDRDALEISFPRVLGYRTELPDEQLQAIFTEESHLTLTPDLVGPGIVHSAGIIGQSEILTLDHLQHQRPATIAFHLAKRLVTRNYATPNQSPPDHLFPQLKAVAQRWIQECLSCKGGTFPAQLLYDGIAQMACNRIMAAITRHELGKRPITAILDPFNPTDSTAHVHFTTSKPLRHAPRADRCHLNYLVLDSSWEGELCRVVENHPQTLAYVKNHSLGFEVPYRLGSEMRKYRPDFLVRFDDGRGPDNPLNLVIEVKGYRREDAVAKKEAIETYWIPAINHMKSFGRWAFLELDDPYLMESQIDQKIAEVFQEKIASLATGS